MLCFFATDLHGSLDRYRKLFGAIRAERPAAVFLGGDLLPSFQWCTTTVGGEHRDFVNDVLAAGFEALRRDLGPDRPRVFLILGNDDGCFDEAAVLDVATRGLWEYLHFTRRKLGSFQVYGYSFVPPTPFLLKDWERYDVSRYVPPGATPPEEGVHSVPISEHEVQYRTIAEDLEALVAGDPMDRAVLLFHGPPYETRLDRAALDGMSVDHVPLDLHVGSIAVRRFIEKRQPLLTLHGHIHESARLTGSWQDRIGRTWMLGGAHDGPELALVRFDPTDPASATRSLL